MSATSRTECGSCCSFLFFFNDTATTEIYTLSLHDALPISAAVVTPARRSERQEGDCYGCQRSEEHTSELQSHSDLVCRLLLEKKNIAAFHHDLYRGIQGNRFWVMEHQPVFFFNDTATTEIYTLSLHDALPI